MVGSPSDVTNGLSIVPEAISRWNAHYGQDRRILLLPLAWSTHSSPEFGNRPQAILNRQLVEKSDLLVAIFWTRLGTPTGEAESGTVEEIREHIRKKKPVLVYFCEQKIDFDADLKQLEKVKSFRAELQLQGLVDSYKDDSELLAKLEKHFAQKILNDPYFQRKSPDVLNPLSQEAIDFLETVAKDNGEIAIQHAVYGALISTRLRTFPTLEPRDRAKYEGFIEDLEKHGFIKAVGSERELFRVTAAGYKFIDNAGSPRQVPRNEVQPSGVTRARGDVIPEGERLLELAKSDPRAAIKKSWEGLADNLFRTANVSGGDAHPDSDGIKKSLERLAVNVRFSESFIGLIRALHETARKVFNQSQFAYDPPVLEAQNFILLSKTVSNDLGS